MGIVRRHSAQVLSIVFIILGWAFVAWFLDFEAAIPGPLLVGKELLKLIDAGYLFGPLGATLGRTAVGFLLGFTAGIAYGVLSFTSRRFREYTNVLITIGLFVPTLIIIFIGLVMFGRANMVAILIIGFAITPEIAIYVRDSFFNFNDDLTRMARSYHVTLGSRVIGMYIPFLVPTMLAAGRIGFSLAWKVAFLAEVFGFPNGLGWEVRSAYRIYDMQTLLAYLVVFVATLLIIETATRTAEERLVRWR